MQPAVAASPPRTDVAPRQRYVYLTAGINGAAVMIVEILGAKMLSPFMGTSHLVWTAQIAVTLVALACGYYAGGKLADRSQDVRKLYLAMIVAALYLTLSTTFIKPVAFQCLDLSLALGALAASTLLFFVPLALLAMTTPFLIRLLTSTLSNVGPNVGRLTALSTLGSFFGTLLIGYLLIPFVPNSTTMYLTAGALLAVATGHFIRR